MIEPIFCEMIPDELKYDWEQLLKVSEKPNFQFSFDYIQSWNKNLRNKWKLLILQYKSESKLKGIVPLMYQDEKRWGILPFRRIRFIGSTHTDFSVFLASPENLKELTFEFLSWINAKPFRWDLMILDDLEGKNSIIEYLLIWLKSNQIVYRHIEGKYFYIDLNKSWEEIINDTSKKFVKRNINLAKNRISKEGHWELIINPDWNSDRIIKEASKMHIQRQADLDRSSLFTDINHINYIKSLIDTKLSSIEFKTFWLNLNNKPIAYLFGFEQDGIFYAWNMSFDIKFSHLFPSKLLLHEIIKYCHDCKFDRFHFMRGESDYKKKWTRKFEINNRIFINNTNSILGRLFFIFDKIIGRW